MPPGRSGNVGLWPPWLGRLAVRWCGGMPSLRGRAVSPLVVVPWVRVGVVRCRDSDRPSVGVVCWCAGLRGWLLRVGRGVVFFPVGWDLVGGVVLQGELPRWRGGPAQVLVGWPPPREGVLVWCISREPLCGVGGPLDVDVGGSLMVGLVVFEVAILGVPASVTIL